MKFLYGIFIRIYGTAIRIAALFNPKAKLWIKGREGFFKDLNTHDFSGDWYWFHTASLGEYEQAKPVISALRKKHKNLKFLVTFFSPSGYEVRKKDPLADLVLYLPLDTNNNAKSFVKTIKPKLAVFVRYEFWPNFMDALFEAKIPTAVMAANFREDQFMFKPLGGFILNRIKRLNAVMVQTDKAKALLLNNGFQASKISVSGNSRIDQVIQIAATSPENKIIAEFTTPSRSSSEAMENPRTLILGSCYAQEESFTYDLIKKHPDLKIIIAPHYIDNENVTRLQKALPVKSIRYSEIKNQDLAATQVLVLDTMGMLSSLFKYADFALIGGGFKDGIHSILEPASSFLPLFFGPRHQPFPEAKALIDLGGAFEINSKQDFEKAFENIYQNNSAYQNCSSAIKGYMGSQKGATDKIVGVLEAL